MCAMLPRHCRRRAGRGPRCSRGASRRRGGRVQMGTGTRRRSGSYVSHCHASHCRQLVRPARAALEARATARAKLRRRGEHSHARLWGTREARAALEAQATARSERRSERRRVPPAPTTRRSERRRVPPAPTTPAPLPAVPVLAAPSPAQLPGLRACVASASARAASKLLVLPPPSRDPTAAAVSVSQPACRRSHLPLVRRTPRHRPRHRPCRRRHPRHGRCPGRRAGS